MNEQNTFSVKGVIKTQRWRVIGPTRLFVPFPRLIFCNGCFTRRAAYYVHATKVKLTTKEPSATYQICLWSQRGTTVINMPHHGDILMRSPPWFVSRTKNPFVNWSLYIWEVTQRRTENNPDNVTLKSPRLATTPLNSEMPFPTHDRMSP